MMNLKSYNERKNELKNLINILIIQYLPNFMKAQTLAMMLLKVMN